MTRDALPLYANRTQLEHEFRTSVLVPFAANIVLELYQCKGRNGSTDEYTTKFRMQGDQGNDDHDGHDDDHDDDDRGHAPPTFMVRILHNERPWAIPGCGGGELCPWSTFQQLYGKFWQCSWSEICRLP